MCKKKEGGGGKGILKNDIDQDLSIYLLFFTKNRVAALNFSLQKRLQSPFRYGFYGLRVYYFHGLLKSHVGYTSLVEKPGNARNRSVYFYSFAKISFAFRDLGS